MSQRKPKLIQLFVVLLIVAGLVLSFQVVSPSAAVPVNKIDPYLLDQLSTSRSTVEAVEFIVRFNGEIDRGLAHRAGSRVEKSELIYQQLAEMGLEQQSFLAAIEARYGLELVQPLWLINGAVMRGSWDGMSALAQLDQVAFIYGNPVVEVDRIEQTPVVVEEISRVLEQDSITWGIDQIDAERVWASGVTGDGAIIGGQDTGYDWDHPALVNQYRGYNVEDGSVSHAYNWHDSIREDFGTNGNRCGFDVDEACDDGYHGTHTMGTMVGRADGNDIGVAPDADWIGCRNMEEGFGKPSTYIECFEWFLAPTDLDGNNPDPSKAPHVINNSWGCPPIEGCNSANFELMEIAVNNLRAAGVVVVASAGNSGPGCGSVDDPAAIFAGSFSVGATNSSDAITSFSSRGPVTVDGSNRLKPNIVAPGQNVLSAVPNTGYASLQGTSMAAPHVAGTVALLVSADPTLAGEVDLLETIITESAVPLTTTQGCGGDTSTSVPNHVFGYGRLDAFAAYQQALEPASRHLLIEKTVPDRMMIPDIEDLLSVTITSSIKITNQHPISDLLNIEIRDRLPENGILIQASGAYTETGGDVVWMIDRLAPGEQITVDVQYQLSISPTQQSTVTIPGASVSSSEIPLVEGGEQTVVIQSLVRFAFIPFVQEVLDAQ